LHLLNVPSCQKISLQNSHQQQIIIPGRYQRTEQPEKDKLLIDDMVYKTD